MGNLLTIHLKDLRFFCFHGLYEEEQIDGNYFIINTSIEFQPENVITSIDETIDYVNVYQLIKTRMEIATPLLETIVMDIANEVLNEFSQAISIQIQLFKENPPIPNFVGSVGVSYTQRRN